MADVIPAVRIGDLCNWRGREVQLQGWLYGRRSGGKVVFLLVRDGTGICQCVVEMTQAEVFRLATELPQESSLRIRGTIREDARSPGGVELAATGLDVIHTAQEYPISRKSHGIEFLMAHRHLWFRTPRQSTLLRVRHGVIKACRDFFDERGFTLVDTPILTPAAGEDRQTLFPVEFFGEKAFLAQTGQLYLESACMALGKVYCFGPTFRAEKSKTRRHLAEFWMIEPEVAFADLAEVMALAEDFICTVTAAVVAQHRNDLVQLGRDVGALEKIQKPFPRMTYGAAAEMLRSPALKRMLEEDLAAERAVLQRQIDDLHALEQARNPALKAAKAERAEDAIRELRDAIRERERDLAVRPEHIALAQSFTWGHDLGGSDETILSRQFDRPVFVTDYPRAVKAFYMKVSSSDPRTVLNFDLLAPEGYGEIIGGSQREDDLDTLIASMQSKGLRPDDYSWYLDLRRYGSVPHGGFGLGLERLLSWLCGLPHVRETIPFPRMMGKMEQ